MNNQDYLNLPVHSVMSRNVLSVDIDSNLLIVDKIFNENQIHHIPVLKGNEVVGMISQGDILLMKDWGTRLNLKVSEKINHTLLKSNLAQDIMSQGVVSVSSDFTLKQCASLFKENLFHALPVVDNGILVGIITTFDLLVVAYTPQALIK